MKYCKSVSSIGRVTFDGRRLDPWVCTDAAGGPLRVAYQVLLSDGTALPLCRAYAEGREAAGIFRDYRQRRLIGSGGLVLPGFRLTASPAGSLHPIGTKHLRWTWNNS